MFGLFAPYAIVGVVILAGYVITSLILALLLGKIIGRVWIAIPVVLIMIVLFYFLELNFIFASLLFLAFLVLFTYVFKKIKNKQ